MADANIEQALWLALGRRGNAGDGLLYEVTRALFEGRLDLDFRSVQLGSYIRAGDPPPANVVVGPGAVLAGTFSSKKLQPALTDQWAQFGRARYHLWSTGLSFAPAPEEIPDVLRVTRRTRQLYVRGTREAEFFRGVDPDLNPIWAPCASLFTERLLDLEPRKKDVVVVNFDSFLFRDELAHDHPLQRFKDFAEAQGLEVRSLINGRPDLNAHLLEMFPMIDIDRPYFERFAHEYDSAGKFTKDYNAALEAHHSLGDRHNDCRFAFGKRLHGWLPFMAFDTPSAFIGLDTRRGFPRDYFGSDEFLCDVPRGSEMSRASLERMASMMVEKLQYFIDNEDRLRSQIAERRAGLWEQLQAHADSFVDVLREPPARLKTRAPEPTPEHPQQPLVMSEPRTAPADDSRPMTTIIAFCESINQVRIANDAAREWAPWTRVIGVTFARTFGIEPGAILSATDLHDFVLLDRYRDDSLPEKDLLLAVDDWLAAVPGAGENDVCVLSFNDGSRLARRFVRKALDLGLPGFVIQDGYLGHETDVSARTLEEFHAVHASLLDGARDLQASIADPKLRDLYRRHASTTKIGATGDCIYFVRGQDIKVKMCMRHGVRPEQVHVVGSVHAALDRADHMEARDPEPSRRPRALYVGQCHTLHGKADEATWLRLSRQIFQQLADSPQIDFHYKFHPSESPRMRELLGQQIPETITVLEGDVLTPATYRRYDYILTETSTALLDAVRAGAGGIVIEIPELGELLPRVDSPGRVHYTSLSTLRADLAAISAGTAMPAEGGTHFDFLEAPPVEDLFGAVATAIRSRVDMSASASSFAHTGPRDRAQEIATRIAPDLHALMHRVPSGGWYLSTLEDPQVLFAHLDAKELARLVPAIMALLGTNWAGVFRARVAELGVEYQSPELAVIAELLASADDAEVDRLLRTIGDPPSLKHRIRLTKPCVASRTPYEQRLDQFFAAEPWACPDGPAYAFRLLTDHPSGLSDHAAVDAFTVAAATTTSATPAQRAAVLRLAAQSSSGIATELLGRGWGGES